MIQPTIEELILNGIVELSGIDSDTGEFLYNFTEKLKKDMPELWNKRMEFIKSEITFFWENGFLEVENFETNEPIIMLTEMAFDEYEIAKLSKERQHTLKEIIRMLEEQ